MLKGCFAEGPFSFAGEHYTITDHDGQPKPVQRPHPPFLIGGGGQAHADARRARGGHRRAWRRGSCRASASDADVSLTLAAAEEKIGWVREAAGDRFDDLEFNVYPSTWPDHGDRRPPRRGSAASSTACATGPASRSTVDEVLESPHMFIGSVDGLVEKFRMLRERLGITSFMVGDIDELAPVVERLAGT